MFPTQNYSIQNIILLGCHENVYNSLKMLSKYLKTLEKVSIVSDERFCTFYRLKCSNSLHVECALRLLW